MPEETPPGQGSGPGYDLGLPAADRNQTDSEVRPFRQGGASHVFGLPPRGRMGCSEYASEGLAIVDLPLQDEGLVSWCPRRALKAAWKKVGFR